MVEQHSSPAAPPQALILPWLAQPLTPLLWMALGVMLLVAVVMLAGVRRSPQRCPISARWLAVGTVVSVAFFAAISFGGQFANPVTVYAAPVFIVVSTVIARAAWHADGDAPMAGRVVGAALAIGAALATACVLGCVGLLWLAIKDPRLDLDLGMGVGEAVTHLLPAVGAVAVPLALLPAADPRTSVARRAVIAFAGLFILILSSTAVVGAAVMTTLQPVAAALGDKYTDVNAAVAVPPLLGSLCALIGVALTRLSTPRSRLLFALVIAGATTGAASGWFGRPTEGERVLGLDWWQLPACVAMGLIVGILVVSLRPLAAPLRVLFAIAGVVATVMLGGVLGARLAQHGGGQSVGDANEFSLIAARLLAVMGVFAVSAAAPLPGPVRDETPRRELVSGVLMTACVLIGMLPVCAQSLRSELTFQARKFSTAYVYESNRQIGPEMLSILQFGPHAIHIAGTRWAWVMPQSTWWTRDSAWRDGLILVDYRQTNTGESDPVGTLCQAVITGADRKRSDIPFTDSQYMALVRPVPTPQKSPIIHTVTARFSTPAQVWGWARLTPSNLRIWPAVLLGLPAAWWLTRKTRTLTAAAAVSAGCILALALLTGVAGVFGFLGGVSVLTLITAARRDDGSRCSTVAFVVAGVAAGLMAVVIPLADLL